MISTWKSRGKWSISLRACETSAERERERERETEREIETERGRDR